MLVRFVKMCIVYRTRIHTRLTPQYIIICVHGQYNHIIVMTSSAPIVYYFVLCTQPAAKCSIPTSGLPRRKSSVHRYALCPRPPEGCWTRIALPTAICSTATYRTGAFSRRSPRAGWRPNALYRSSRRTAFPGTRSRTKCCTLTFWKRYFRAHQWLYCLRFATVLSYRDRPPC